MQINLPLIQSQIAQEQRRVHENNRPSRRRPRQPHRFRLRPRIRSSSR